LYDNEVDLEGADQKFMGVESGCDLSGKAKAGVMNA
jgi:hypothetical protein